MDVHVLSEFSICIDVVDKHTVDEAEVAGSNHIPIPALEPHGDGDRCTGEDENTFGENEIRNDASIDQSVVDMLPLEIASSHHIPVAIPKQQDDEYRCDGEYNNIHGDNEIRNGVSVGAQSCVNGSKSESVGRHVSEETVRDVVIADYVPTTLRMKNIYSNKSILKYHLH